MYNVQFSGTYETASTDFAGKIHTLRSSFPNGFGGKFLKRYTLANLNRNFTLFAKKFFKRCNTTILVVIS